MTSDDVNHPGQAGSEAAGGSLMLADAREAPAAVARLLSRNAAACARLGERLSAAPPAFAVTCARGSSDSAATYAKYLLEIKLGVVTASVGPSVSSVYGTRLRMKGTLFLAISQSGRSPDLLQLAESARNDGALTVALVNDDTSPLAGLCEIVLPLHAGAERSIAATKSYITSLAAILQLVGAWSGDKAVANAIERLPDDLTAALTHDWSAAIAPLKDAGNLFVVGRGPGLAVAQEAALKLKETSGMHAEAVSAAELMHGPLALAGTDFPVLAFSQGDKSLAGLRELATGLALRGVPVVVAGPAADAGTVGLASADISPLSQPIALVQSFYPFADALARVRGCNPDLPPHLVKITRTI